MFTLEKMSKFYHAVMFVYFLLRPFGIVALDWNEIRHSFSKGHINQLVYCYIISLNSLHSENKR